MIIHILIPHFWIVVEEQRKPELRERPVIIGSSFLEKTGGHIRVLMANTMAETYGVASGMTLAHARQLCPEAVILSPELPLYDGVWDEVMALLLTYTPLVESLDPGEALCDVSGCERLFGDPVFMAQGITGQIEALFGLPAVAGVGANPLVAQLAAGQVQSSTFNVQRSMFNVQCSTFNVQRGGAPSTRNEQHTANTEHRTPNTQQPTANSQQPIANTEHRTPNVAFVPPGQEAAFLAPFPVTALPDIDPKTLVAFQVLGLKTVDHLTRISEKAFESRFGPLGRRLARQARGCDDRPVRPAPQAPAMSVSRRCDDDLVDGLEPDRALTQLVDLLAADLSDALKERHLAGRLVTLVLRAGVQRSMFNVQRGEVQSSEFYRGELHTPVQGSDVQCSTFNVQRSTASNRRGWTPGLPSRGASDAPPHDHPTVSNHGLRLLATQPSQPNPSEQFFPNQDSRIHSMLPQPLQPGKASFLTSTPNAQRTTHNAQRTNPQPVTRNPQPATRTLARTATSRPVDDRRTLAELSYRLLLRILGGMSAQEAVRPGTELQLEIRHFAPPEQLTLPGLDGRPLDGRLGRLHRQENILASRFGATPFRHLAAVDLDSILSERIFSWGDGMASGSLQLTTTDHQK